MGHLINSSPEIPQFQRALTEHSLSPVSPQGQGWPRLWGLPAAAPLPIHPGAPVQAQVHLNLPLQRRSGYSLASRGSRFYKTRFLSSINLLVIPDFYTPSQGAAAFAAVLQEAQHTRDRNRCCCHAARDNVTQWLAQISIRAAAGRARGPHCQPSSRPCSKKPIRRGKGMELQVQQGQGTVICWERYDMSVQSCDSATPANTQVYSKSAVWLTASAPGHYRQRKHLQFSLLCQILTIYAICNHVICW